MKKTVLFITFMGMFLFFNPLMAQEDSSANDNVEMVEEGTTDGDSALVEEVQEPVEEVVE